MKLFQKAAAALAAVVLSGAIAFAASIPFFTQLQSADTLGAFNNLINNINTQVSGLVVSVPGPVASVATTNAQTLASAVIPAGQLKITGQSLRIYCNGYTAANGHTKSVTVAFGSQNVVGSPTETTGNFTGSASSWELEMIVTYVTSQQATWFGRGSEATTVVAPTASNDTNDIWSTQNLTASCTTTQGTASAGDVNLATFLVEQIK
jgi:hypothetical protein